MKKIILEELIKIGTLKNKGYLIKDQRFYENMFNDLDLSYFTFENCTFERCEFSRINAYLSRWENCQFKGDRSYKKIVNDHLNAHNSFILAYFKGGNMIGYNWAFSNFQGSRWNNDKEDVSFNNINFSDGLFEVNENAINRNICFKQCDFTNIQIKAENKQLLHDWLFDIYTGRSSPYFESYTNSEISLNKNIFSDTIIINGLDFPKEKLLHGLENATEQEKIEMEMPQAILDLDYSEQLLFTQSYINSLEEQFAKSPVYSIALNKFIEFNLNAVYAHKYLDFTNLLIKYHKTILKFIEGSL